ncbi:peptidylprolyl isomerase [Fibrobacterota bacterium]
MIIFKAKIYWVAIFLVFSIAGFTHLNAAVKGTAIITVNKTKITKERVDSLVDLLAQSQFEGRVLNPQERDYLEKVVAGNLVGQELLIEESKGQKIKVTKGEIDTLEQAFREGFKDKAEYERALIKVGDTKKSIRKKLEKEIKIKKLLENHLTPLKRPTEDEMIAFFKKQRNQFSVDDTMRASQIVLKLSKKTRTDENEAKRKKLEQIRSELSSETMLDIIVERFAVLAAQNSETPEAKMGGDLQRFVKGDFFTEFYQNIKNLEVGQMSEVFRSPIGYHLVLLTEKNDGRYENYRLKILQLMVIEQTQNNQQALQDYLKNLMKKHKVTYVDKKYKGNLSVNLESNKP